MVVIDGGLATELEAEGHHLGDELWSARLLADEPEAIVAAHLAYFRSRRPLTITVSYQATFEGFALRGIDHEEAAALLRRSVTLAGEARDRYRAEMARADSTPGCSSFAGSVGGVAAPADARPLLVAASVGRYGAWLADRTEYPRAIRPGSSCPPATSTASGSRCSGAQAPTSRLRDDPGHRRQPGARRPGHEAAAPAWLALSCADGGHLRDGTPAEEAAAIATRRAGSSPSAELHGARARRGAGRPDRRHHGEAGRRLSELGRGVGGRHRARLPASGPDVDVATAPPMDRRRARLVGGCCRVGPRQISDLAAAFGL